ncbi:Acetylcholine receptor subunit beta-like 1 [Hypsibius exemplaris]|uniref:Acetylcholine receptor subunit beta-like 1 n=1 Tax=Hypsibius exemplaris TaxID=2072580 RepID=A0A1W0X7P7_HYPEX|nr:Acetylcholine receptor subunit beta-like 1 [Hypsibius exemplaris]
MRGPCLATLCSGLLRIILLNLLIPAKLSIEPVYASDDQGRLIRTLFRDYNPLVRPVLNNRDTVNVTFAMTLGLLIYVNEREQVMKTNGYTVLEWTDPNLKWDISDYGGILALRMPVDKVWTPDVVLLTNTDGKFGPSYKSNVVIYSTGTVNWMPPFIYKSSCQIEVKNFPFDQQTCEMRFSSWTYTALEVDIHLKQVVVDVKDYSVGGIWDLEDATIERKAYNRPDYVTGTDVSPRVVVIVTIVIRRKTLFYTVNLLIPTVLIAFMTVVVFLLPTVAGEKVTLTISLTLSIVVFLLLVSKILPPADAMPLISKFLLFIFIMNLISVFMTVITINLNFRGPKTHDMARPLRLVFLHFLPKFLLMKRPPPRYQKRRRTVKPNKAQTMLEEPWNWNATKHAMVIPNGNIGSFRLSNRPSSNRSAATSTRPPNNVAPLAQLPEVDPFWDDEEIPVGRRGPEPPPRLGPDRIAVAESVDYIANHMEWNDGIKLIEEDWKFLALVVDRILLWIFFWVTCAGSISILLDSEYIFSRVDGEATKNRLVAMLV